MAWLSTEPVLTVHNRQSPPRADSFSASQFSRIGIGADWIDRRLWVLVLRPPEIARPAARIDRSFEGVTRPALVGQPESSQNPFLNSGFQTVVKPNVEVDTTQPYGVAGQGPQPGHDVDIGDPASRCHPRGWNEP